ncbi:hypothetical protein MHUMG1_09643 [Metarhizium humberi]|uniref:S-(Hydroxymethyl)glutathione dehydrogenase n=1 Tax=Metarhizium humberi TaxID=2596975 RepID=A0A9P8S2P7_9HYPO|nr:hypothetical protein MHUMG1_09643 [Metarhizium humberi]
MQFSIVLSLIATAAAAALLPGEAACPTTKGSMCGVANNGGIDNITFPACKCNVGCKGQVKILGVPFDAWIGIACGDCFYCKKKQSSQCEKTNANAKAKAIYGDTGVEKGDSVAIFGAGPIGHMAGVFALDRGAKRIIFVDTEPRLSYIKSHFPRGYMSRVGLVDFKTVSSGITNSKTAVSRLKEICDGRGPDVALECAGGEYAKGWLHWLDMATGAETDTSEIVNEMIESVHSFGRCGITFFNVGYRGIKFIGNGQAPVHMYWKDLLAAIQRK